MDEESALRMVFRENCVVDGDRMVISNGGNRFEIDRRSMRIVDPRFEYSDCYNYILRAETVRESIQRVYEPTKETERITEEEFMRWKRENAGKKSVPGMSGKDVWLSQEGEEGRRM